MALQRRPGMSSSEKSAVWERWRRGESQTEIARNIDRAKTQVGRVLRAGGGIVRPPRRRSRLALSLPEREEISRGLASGDSMRRIALGLGRSPFCQAVILVSLHRSWSGRLRLGPVALGSLVWVARAFAARILRDRASRPESWLLAGRPPRATRPPLSRIGPKSWMNSDSLPACYVAR